MKKYLLSLKNAASQKIFATSLMKPFQQYFLAAFLTSCSLGVSGQTTVFSDDFASASSGENTTAGGSGTVWNGDVNFPTVVNTFQAGGAVRLGSGLTGSLTSKIVNLSTDGGNVKVTFDVKGWTTVEAPIKVTITGQTSQTVTYAAVLSTATFETKTVSFIGGVAGSKVTIETTAKRAFIDNVKVETIPSCASPTPTWVTAPSSSACSNTDQFYETQSGKTNYVWTLSGTAGTDYIIINGGNASSNTMTVRYLTKGGHNVTVGYTSGGCAGAMIYPGYVQILNGVSIGPLMAQNIIAGTDGNQLNASEDGMVVSRDWKYGTSSGGPFVSFATPVTGGSYIPNFPSAGTYFVICEDTFSCGILRSNEITINVTAVQQPVINSSATNTTVYGTPGSYQITASNSSTSYAVTSAATWPTGFSFNASTGLLSAVASTDAGIYSFDLTANNSAGASNPFNFKWTINKKPVTISGVTVAPKSYDQTITATLNLSVVSINPLLASDAGQVTVANTGYVANYNNKNAGTNKAVTFTTGLSLSGSRSINYTISTQPSLAGIITKKDISVTGIVANDKTYDTTTSVIFDINGITGNTIYSGDVASYSVAGAFQTPAVGTHKPIDVTAVNLTGTDGGNYNVTPLPAGLTSNITKAIPILSPSALTLGLSENQDLILLVTSTNTATALAFTVPVGNGIVSLLTATTINADALGNTTLTITQAADTNYNQANVTIPVIVEEDPAQTGDYKTIKDGNWNVNTNWQIKNAAGNWVSTIYPGTNTSSTIFIKNKVTLNLGNVNFKNIVVTSTGEMSQNDSGGMTILSNGKLLIKNKGTFINSAVTKFASATNSIFEIEDGGTLINNYSSKALTDNLFSGKEIFHPNSNFIVKAVSGNTFLTDFAVLNPYDAGFGNVAYFGNLIIESGIKPITLIDNVKSASMITNGNLIIRNTSAPTRLLNDDGTTSSLTDPFTIGGNFIVESNSTGNVNLRNNKVDTYFKIKKDLQLNGGSTFRSSAENTLVYLYIDGDLKISDTASFRFTDASSFPSATLAVFLKGDIQVGASASLTNLNTATNNASIYFTGNGDGKTANTTQTIEIAEGTSDQKKIDFQAGYQTLTSYVQLLTDTALGTNSTFTVNFGNTLDFNFNSVNTPNNLKVYTGQNGQKFSVEKGGYLKISSPEGVSSGANSGYIGNVQVGSSLANRKFDAGATYHYIGKTNQVTGNGLLKDAANKYIIVELENDAAAFASNNGIIRFNNPPTAIGPNFRGLEIRKGMVISDNDGSRFEDSVVTGEKGNLKMTGGTFKLTAKGVQPSLTGAYVLSEPSKIDFALTSTADTQSIKGGAAYIYPAIEVSGKSVTHTSANINMKSGGSFTVKEGGVLSSQGTSGQIISSDDNSKASLIIEDNGTFATQRENGFYGPVDGLRPAPSVRNNIILSLMQNSTVEYSRLGVQTITSQVVGLSPNQYNYQNLKISGSGAKKALGITTVNQKTAMTSADATLLVPEYSAADGYSVFYALGGIDNSSGNAGTFILGNDAQLMQAASADNTKAKVEARRNLNLTDSRKEYNYLISPVKEQEMKSIVGGNAANIQYVTKLNEGTSLFVNAGVGAYIPGLAFGVKEPYSSYADNNGLAYNVANFKGEPYNSDLDFQLYKTAGNRGYNLSGNPYPSNLDLDALYLASTDIESTFRFWDNKANNIYAQQGGGYLGYSYALYNANVGTGNPAAAGNGMSATGTEPNHILKVGQGFMIRVKPVVPSVAFPGTAATLRYKNNQRIIDQIDAPFFGRNAHKSTKDRYWLEYVTPSNLIISNAVVYFAGGTNLFSDDDTRLSASSDALYSVAGDEKVVINGRSPFDTTDVVPLGIKSFSAGNYKIRLGKKEGVFASGQTIFLKDKQLGILTDLTAGAYSFISESGEFSNRFEILYKEGRVLTTDHRVQSKIEIYRDTYDFVIRSSDRIITHVEVYDTSGRLVMALGGNSREIRFTSDRLVTGVYILKINQNGQVTSKKIAR